MRITTRYEEDDFTKSLMAVIHETGHALYQDGLPIDWRDQPVGDHRGMTVHESQSLLLEMQAGRSQEFLHFLAPVLKEQLKGGDHTAWEADNLLQLYRKVEPGLIRGLAAEHRAPDLDAGLLDSDPGLVERRLGRQDHGRHEVAGDRR